MISELCKIYMQDIITGICVTYPRRKRGVTFHSLLVTRWNLLVACSSSQKLFDAKNHSLLVAKFARYCCKIGSLLVAEVARCKKSVVTRCKIPSLLVAKFARYSLQKLLLAKNHSLLVAKFACYSLQKLLVTRCRSCSLQKITHYLLQNSLVTRYRNCSLQKITRYSLHC